MSPQSPFGGVNSSVNPSHGRRSRLLIAVSLAALMLAALPAVGSAVFAGTPQEQLLGTWTVKFSPSPMNAFGKNIRRPAEIIDGTVLKPGETFNFAQAAGPFTEANGYSSGAAIIRKRIVTDGIIGGGLCSAATTLFNAAARAGLRIDARANHSFYISRYPVGLDATIWVNKRNQGKNMVFTNDLDQPITIKGITGKRFVTFEIWGVGDGRKTNFGAPAISNPRAAEGTDWYYSDDVRPGRHKLIVSKVDGFDVTVTRTVRAAGGSVLGRDSFRSHYRAQNGVMLLGRRPGDPPDGTRVENPPDR